MEKFLTTNGLRKTMITALMAALFSLMLDHARLSPEAYKELMLALIAVYFGANLYENKAKGNPQEPGEKK